MMRAMTPVGSGVLGRLARGRSAPLPMVEPVAAADWPVDLPPLGDTTAEDTIACDWMERGRRLARQEAWEEIGREIRRQDRARASTPAGAGLAQFLAAGARADVVLPVQQALSDPGLMSAHAPRGGVKALEEVLEDHPDDYGVALVVAHTHVDIGWAWRGHGWISEVPERHWDAFHHHFDRASEILDAFDPFEHDSPSLAAARCALLSASDNPRDRVRDDYEDLIDLDPGNPLHMRALGNHLLPRWFGSYEMLEAEARRTAHRTRDVWGVGGYAWVQLDAIAADPGVLKRLDVALFLRGLHDILSRRRDPHHANQIAAFCAETLAQPRYHEDPIGLVADDLRSALDWIVPGYLLEVHPMVWGMAPGRGATPDTVDELAALGRARAHACLLQYRRG